MKIHFIGIGGIGVSALAKYYLAKGAEVSGCDLVASEITDQLKKMGAKIRIGVPDLVCSAGAEKIVYSPAVPMTHPEIRSTKFEILSYPQALGELTKKYFTIAVSGTHGKSTTTAMIGLLLAKAGLDPTVIVGTKLKEFGNSNFRMGGKPDSKYPPSLKLRRASKILVIEADEHFASFLNYWPKMIVLTTIEEDHLDYYKNLRNILKAFKKYIAHLPPKGHLIVHRDDPNIRKILRSKNNHIATAVEKRIHYFSLKQKEAARLRKILKIPGEHNVANALAALEVARALRVPDSVSFKALGEYHGSWRRFEIFNVKKPVPYTLVSDYGHHPTEVRVTVQAAREKWPLDTARGKPKEIWLVFQPHQYQRTHYLWKDFVRVLSKLPVQKLILTDIYDVAGREETQIKKKVSSKKLIEAIESCKLEIENYPVHYIPTLKEVEAFLKKNLRGGEIVMIMGAGDIYNLTRGLAKRKIKL